MTPTASKTRATRQYSGEISLLNTTLEDLSSLLDKNFHKTFLIYTSKHGNGKFYRGPTTSWLGKMKEKIYGDLEIFASVLTLYSLISVCIFSVLFSLRFQQYQQESLTIKSFFSWWSFPLFSWPSCVIQGRYCKEKLDASHS